MKGNLLSEIKRDFKIRSTKFKKELMGELNIVHKKKKRALEKLFLSYSEKFNSAIKDFNRELSGIKNKEKIADKKVISIDKELKEIYSMKKKNASSIKNLKSKFDKKIESLKREVRHKEKEQCKSIEDGKKSINKKVDVFMDKKDRGNEIKKMLNQ